MALTIEIPKCDAAESAEDRLAKHILDMLANSKNGSASFDYYYRGCAVGSCCNSSIGSTSLDVIDSVLRSFRNAGYLVDIHFCGNNLATVHVKSK